MFFRILKKDLKRKKVMNIIILLFVTLSTLFVASSMNNIVTVMNGLDYFFEKANMPDYLAGGSEEGTSALVEKLHDCPGVKEVGTEEMVAVSKSRLTVDGNEIKPLNTIIYMMSANGAYLNYYSKSNEIITEPEPGTVLVPSAALKSDGLRVGDVIALELNGTEYRFEVAGSVKDAVFGAQFVSNDRMIISEADYEMICASATDESFIYIYYVSGDDLSAVEKTFSQEDGILFSMATETYKMGFMADMITAGILLVISVCLILIAFVTLRFTIVFTLNEEFREIGVMKAIGIPNGKIRLLYVIKYLGIAAVGSLVGFIGSIPLASALLESVSRNIVLGTGNVTPINLISSVFVVIVIVGFCFACTRKVKKLAPVDAVRDGTTGERFTKKRGLRLGKTRVRPAFFMALNDVLCSLRRYMTAIIAFTLCLLLLLTLDNAANTVQSGEMLKLAGMRDSHAGVSFDEISVDQMLGDDIIKIVKNKNAEVERLLDENGMPGRCSVDLLYSVSFNHGDRSVKSLSLLGVGTTADEYSYYEGTAPKNKNEIAVSSLISEKLDAKIGDTVTVAGMEDGEFIVTALFQSLINMGEGVRFQEDANLTGMQSNGMMSFQIDFDDDPSQKTVNERIEKLKDVLGTEKVGSAKELAENFIGVADIVDPLKALTTALTLIIVALVTVLMERSFISNERSEIALEKAIGLKNGTVIAHHMLRFGIIGVVSVAIALLLALPATQLCITPIFGMFGLRSGINYQIDPIEVFLIHPALVLATTVLFAFLTSLYTGKIKALDTSSIE